VRVGGEGGRKRRWGAVKWDDEWESREEEKDKGGTWGV